MRITTTLEKFQKGLRKVRESGGTTTINCLDSTIEGSASIQGVVATFEFNQGTLTINIEDKPWLATDSMIEDEINKFF